MVDDGFDLAPPDADEARPYIRALLAKRLDHPIGDLEIHWLAMSSPYPMPAA